MTVLKNKMLVRFEFSEDGQSVTNETEFFQYEWGRLRDICVSPDGKIYLATNGNTWPSQPLTRLLNCLTQTIMSMLQISNPKITKR